MEENKKNTESVKKSTGAKIVFYIMGVILRFVYTYYYCRNNFSYKY